MTEPVLKSAKNDLIKGLIVTGVISLVLYLIPGGWPAVWAVISSTLLSIWNWLGSSTPVYNWLVVVFTLCTITTLGVPLLRWINTLNSVPPAKPVLQQKVLGIVWRWDREDIGSFKKLSPFCPECDLQVFTRSVPTYGVVDETAYYCDGCGWHTEPHEYSPEQFEHKVRRILQRDLRQASEKREANTVDAHE